MRVLSGNEPCRRRFLCWNMLEQESKISWMCSPAPVLLQFRGTVFSLLSVALANHSRGFGLLARTTDNVQEPTCPCQLKSVKVSKIRVGYQICEGTFHSVYILNSFIKSGSCNLITVFRPFELLGSQADALLPLRAFTTLPGHA